MKITKHPIYCTAKVAIKVIQNIFVIEQNVSNWLIMKWGKKDRNNLKQQRSYPNCSTCKTKFNSQNNQNKNDSNGSVYVYVVQGVKTNKLCLSKIEINEKSAKNTFEKSFSNLKTILSIKKSFLKKKIINL